MPITINGFIWESCECMEMMKQLCTLFTYLCNSASMSQIMTIDYKNVWNKIESYLSVFG